MLRRYTVTFFGLLLSVAASHTLGLSLGSAIAESSVNQPLSLRIEILELGEIRADDVSIQMASTEDFIRLGVDPLEVLSSVSFLTQETSDRVYVLLTSSEIIREPYLSFVLETRWPSGRLLSEYRVSLDLPVYSDADQVENRIQQPLSNILDFALQRKPYKKGKYAFFGWPGHVLGFGPSRFGAWHCMEHKNFPYAMPSV